MEKTRYVNLPVIGRVQHGEQTVSNKGTRKVVELGYFIAKIQDSFMEGYLKKFDNQYKGQKSIDIQFFDDNPLTIKQVRYNQSGEVCSCHANSDTARQKVKNGWQEIKCDSSCQYRQRNEQGKSACNRMAWLKFLIPSICNDRIWLMRITGQKSIDRLKDYFELQKMQGNSIKGNYTLFLKQEEQDNYFGQTFNNYVLDILQKDNFNSIKTIPQTAENQEKLSTTNANIVNKPETKKITESKTTVKNDEKNVTQTKKTTTAKKKVTETQETKQEQSKQAKNTKQKEIELLTEPDMDKCYVFTGSHIEDIMKDGKTKKSYIGEFYDMQDKQVNIVVKPEFVEDLSECDLGTIVQLEIQKFGERNIAMDLQYVQRITKKLAA